MKTGLRSLLGACLLVGASSAAAGDELLSAFGYTGLISIPTASVMPTGYAEVQYNRFDYADAHYTTNSNAFLTLGLANRFEIGGALIERLGGPHSINDLSANAKFRLVDDYEWQSAKWSLAAGWADLSSDDKQAHHFQARYLVSTVDLHQVGISLGYGAGPDRLKGLFGGASWAVSKSLSLMADYDGDFTSVGARVSFDAGDVARLYGFGREAFDKTDPGGWGVGGRFNLRFNRTTPWFGSDDGTSGLRDIRTAGTDDTHAVRAENAAFLQRQQDSAAAACTAVDGGASAIDYWQYRYGIPLVRSRVDCSDGHYENTQWLPQFGVAAPAWGSGAFPLNLEIRLGFEEKSFVGVNTGQFRYSTAFQSTARLQGPAGLAAYVTDNVRLAETDDFKDPDGLFNFYRVPSGIREYAAQWAVHPLAGLLGVGTVGRTDVNAIEYDFSHVEAAYYWGQGTTRTRVVYADYVPSDNLPYKERTLKIVSQRYWIDRWNTSVEVGAGRFFYGDKGETFDLTRYFGDFTVTLFARIANDDGNGKVAGLSVGIPLTPHRGLSAGPVSVVGMPRLDVPRSSSFGNNDGGAGNVLMPMLLVEPKPIYNLLTDWMDSDRLYPEYANHSRE